MNLHERKRLMARVQKAGFGRVEIRWNELRKERGLEARTGTAMHIFIMCARKPEHKRLITAALESVETQTK